MANVDPDLLSHFEVQDICVDAGGPINSRIYYLITGGDLEQGLRLITSDDDVTYMCELHTEWPTNEITLYVEPEVEPIAIEVPIVEPYQPIAVDQPPEMNDEDDDTDYEEVTNTVRSSVVDQNNVSEEPVEDDHASHGQTVGSVDVHVDDPDWLDEGYEGPDYPDDIFGTQNNEGPNMREHQRDTENVNEGDGVREPIIDNGKRPVVTKSNYIKNTLRITSEQSVADNGQQSMNGDWNPSNNFKKTCLDFTLHREMGFEDF
ncbi:hypothetical protein SO802_017945 [Lithocarpus litseifolius]|uniref:PB1-like domain-containing protein n=1 Tax=Lithocarpus litseifolius TaxID=425828 RepID=A0AAW2CLS6_9ROSI